MADWFAQNAPQTAAPPPAGDWFAENAPKQQAGFWESVGNAVNPMPAIREWMNRPKAMDDAVHALHALSTIDAEAAKDPANKGVSREKWKRREPTAEEAAVIDRGMNANLPGAEGNILSDTGAPALEAGRQASEGNIRGAAGTLVGGYVVPAVVGAVAPRIPGAARATGRAVKATGKVLAEVAPAAVERIGGMVGGGVGAHMAGPTGAILGHEVGSATGKLVADRLRASIAAKKAAPAAAPELVGPPAPTFDSNSWTGSPQMRGNLPPMQLRNIGQPVSPPVEPVQPVQQLRDIGQSPAPVDIGEARAAKIQAAKEALANETGLRGTIPFSEEAAAPVDFAAKARTERAVTAKALAQFLHNGKIPISDAKLMTPEHWGMAAQGAGVELPASSAKTITEALGELQKLQPGPKKVAAKGRSKKLGDIGVQ